MSRYSIYLPIWKNVKYNGILFCISKAQNCFVEGQIRLRGTGASSSREGRVEMCLDKVWGTVCGYGWDTADARVVCRQLGYSAIGMSIMCQCLANICTILVIYLVTTPFIHAYFFP